MLASFENTTRAVSVSVPEERFLAFGIFQNGIRIWIECLFFLYVGSLTCSMAGMEIFSWTTAFFFLIYLVLNGKKHGIEFYRLGIGVPLMILLAVAALGLRLNAPHGDFVYAMGRLRNFFLIYFMTYTLQLFGNVKRFVLLLWGFATLIAVYGIWQHYTGIDLWRHNHRAVVLLPWTHQKLYSTVGFFNHHLTYAHSYAMILCVPWAVWLVFGKRLTSWQRTAIAFSLALIGTSIIFTYGRGAWLALLFSLPLMATFVNRRWAFGIIICLATVSSVLYQTNTVFRERAQSIFSKDYQSNEERAKLWEANFEMFREHPWIGVGMLQNESESNLYYKKLGITGGMTGHAHNNYIEFLSTTGLIGFSCYLALISIVFIKSLKLFKAVPDEELWTKAIVLAAIGAQITFHLGGLTQCSIEDFKVQHQLFFWFAVILYLSNSIKPRRANIPLTNSLKLQ